MNAGEVPSKTYSTQRGQGVSRYHVGSRAYVCQLWEP